MLMLILPMTTQELPSAILEKEKANLPEGPIPAEAIEKSEWTFLVIELKAEIRLGLELPL